MADLVVLGLDREDAVDDVSQVVERLVSEHLLELEDYVTVVRNMDGKVRINQAFNTTATGALVGAFCGMLIGFLLLVPILGTTLGALSGALAGKLTDIGIND